MENQHPPMSSWGRRILSDGFKIRWYPVIGFCQFLSDVFRLFTQFHAEIRPTNSLISDRIYYAGNDRIRLIWFGRLRYDPWLSVARKSPDSSPLNWTWFPDKSPPITAIGTCRNLSESVNSGHRLLPFPITKIRPESATCDHRMTPASHVNYYHSRNDVKRSNSVG